MSEGKFQEYAFIVMTLIFMIPGGFLGKGLYHYMERQDYSTDFPRSSRMSYQPISSSELQSMHEKGKLLKKRGQRIYVEGTVKSMRYDRSVSGYVVHLNDSNLSFLFDSIVTGFEQNVSLILRGEVVTLNLLPLERGLRDKLHVDVVEYALTLS